jgi:hypothetical protein
MNTKIDIDCTLQDAVLAEMQGRMKDTVAGADPDSLLKTWAPAGLEGWDSMQKTF